MALLDGQLVLCAVMATVGAIREAAQSSLCCATKGLPAKENLFTSTLTLTVVRTVQPPPPA